MISKCFVNRIFGGGVFVCRRPVATKNGFCAYHGNASIGDKDVKFELTWREWFKVQFIRRPKNAVWRMGELYRKPRLAWYLRKHPKCSLQKCSEKALSPEGGKCIDHYYEDLE